MSVSWASLLEDASQTANAQNGAKNILILGDEGVGKTTLVSKLQGRKGVAEDRPLGTGMEYTYFDVKDEESEDVSERMGCFVLNGTADASYMLQLVMTPELISDALVMMVVDLSRPWLIMDSLEKWSNAIGEHLEPFISSDKMEALKAKRVKAFQTFVETLQEGIDGKKEGAAEEEVVLDLDEGVLETNYGIPMIVVATKSDAIESLMQDQDYKQEHLDFIQLHIRRFCLKHGAALVYLGKAGKNKEPLYRSLLSAAYEKPLNVANNISDNDAIFVPSGWDNPNKINVLTDSFQNIKVDDAYADQIKDQSSSFGGNTAANVEAEDVQEFLKKQQPLLGAKIKEAPEPAKPTPATTANPVRPRVTSAGGAGAKPSARPAARAATPGKTPSKAGAKPGGKGDGQNQDVLADFFNSLLQKKGGAGGSTKSRPPASS
jgi:dynein light intermediate chain 1